MAPPITSTLTAAQRDKLKRASARVEKHRTALKAAVDERHKLWRDLKDEGHSQSEIARASDVLRQAIGWAIDHPPADDD